MALGSLECVWDGRLPLILWGIWGIWVILDLEQPSASYSRVASEWTCRSHLISFIAYLFGFYLARWVEIIVMSALFFCGMSELCHERCEVSKQRGSPSRWAGEHWYRKFLLKAELDSHNRKSLFHVGEEVAQRQGDQWGSRAPASDLPHTGCVTSTQLAHLFAAQVFHPINVITK